MAKIFLINAHHKSSFSEGRLNKTLLDTAEVFFKELGHETRTFNTDDNWIVEEQLERESGITIKLEL